MTDYQNLVKKVANLSALPLREEEIAPLARAFEETITLIDELNGVETAGVEPTTRLSQEANRWREDEIVEAQMLTQEEALANAKRVHHGYFVVGRLIDDGS